MTKASKRSEERSGQIVPSLIAATALIVTALLGIAGIVLTHRLGIAKEKEAIARAAAKEMEATARAAHLARLTFYETVNVRLEAAESAFSNQVGLRNRLVESLGRRYGTKEIGLTEYEPLFRKLFPKMNEHELFLCEQMRGLTETLYTHNSAVSQLLTTNPMFHAEVPDLSVLNEHLDLWISKYKHPFKNAKNACLVYVGVEEEKPFPVRIREQIQKIINELRIESSPN